MIYLNLIGQSNTVKLIMSLKAIAFAPFDGTLLKGAVEMKVISANA